MASDCELIVKSTDKKQASLIAEIAYRETKRIEQKYSRYLKGNIIDKIHQYQTVELDAETIKMLEFAKTAYQLSDGLFDITSGVLRKLWTFDGKSIAPSRKQVKALLPLLGFDKINWQEKTIHLPAGMQIDFGGFGKEYAVDRAMELALQAADIPIMVNFGGDLRVNKRPNALEYWQIDIEKSNAQWSSAFFQLERGAIATSGNANRYIKHKGKKLTHILNPRTGWPVSNAPNSVSVGGDNCLQAGVLSTLATLHGKNALAFLEAQNVEFLLQQ